MFVLARRPGDAICIGNDVLLTINDVSGGKVKLGIQAPDHVAVDREEVWERWRKKRDRHPVAQPSGISSCAE
jgi:carbon storage regulator